MGCFSYSTQKDFLLQMQNLMQIFSWYKCKISQHIQWCMETCFLETKFTHKNVIFCSQELFNKKWGVKEIERIKIIAFCYFLPLQIPHYLISYF